MGTLGEAAGEGWGSDGIGESSRGTVVWGHGMGNLNWAGQSRLVWGDGMGDPNMELL